MVSGIFTVLYLVNTEPCKSVDACTQHSSQTTDGLKQILLLSGMTLASMTACH